MLFSFLENSESVDELWIERNHVGDESMSALASLIESNYAISSLWLGGNNITDEGIEIIAPSIIGNTTLQSLGLSYNVGITNESVPIIKEMVQASSLSNSSSRKADGFLVGTGISRVYQDQIMNLMRLPVHRRCIPTRSMTKSAAKSMAID